MVNENMCHQWFNDYKHVTKNVKSEQNKNPNSKHWQLIDYVIVHRKNRQDVPVTKAMCGAESWTDHRLIISKLNIKIQFPRCLQEAQVPRHLNIWDWVTAALCQLSQTNWPAKLTLSTWTIHLILRETGPDLGNCMHCLHLMCNLM